MPDIRTGNLKFQPAKIKSCQSGNERFPSSQTFDMRHEKTDLKVFAKRRMTLTTEYNLWRYVFVVVIPKEGWHLLQNVIYEGYDNDKDLKVCFLMMHVKNEHKVYITSKLYYTILHMHTSLFRIDHSFTSTCNKGDLRKMANLGFLVVKLGRSTVRLG